MAAQAAPFTLAVADVIRQALSGADEARAVGAAGAFAQRNVIPPPSIFCSAPDGLALGDEPFPAVLNTLDDYALGPQNEAVICWGIGAGKSYLASLFLAYYAAWILSQIDNGTFWKRFGLGTNTRIELACFAPTYESAKDIVFSELSPKLRQSPWFAQNFPVDPQSVQRLKFYWPRRRRMAPLEVVYHGSSETGPLGRNIFAAVIDEAAFWMQSSGSRGDVAKEVYTRIKRRISSRFGKQGKILAISSSGYMDSFEQQLLARAEEHPNEVFAQVKKSWEVKPVARYGGAGEAVDVPIYDAKGDVEYTLSGVPADLAIEFQYDQARALRDYCCKPSEALEPFDALGQLAFQTATHPPRGAGACTKLADPFLHDPQRPFALADWFTAKDTSQLTLEDGVAEDMRVYAVHVDLAISGDALGIGMAHPCRLAYQEPGAGRFTATRNGLERDESAVVLDFAASIPASAFGGIVDIEQVRAFICALRDSLGFHIHLVTYDGFQSAQSLQLLRRAGFYARLLSVDRTLEPYGLLKETLQAKRLYYATGAFSDESQRHGLLQWQKEYQRLELIQGKKVDHSPGGSKDAADTAAATVFHARRWGQARWAGQSLQPKLSAEDQAMLAAHRAHEGPIIAQHKQAKRVRVGGVEREVATANSSAARRHTITVDDIAATGKD